MIQFLCEQTPAELGLKGQIASYNIYTQIMSVCMITAFIIYMRVEIKERVSEYDNDNVTPSDYTLYFYVTEKQS